MTIEATSIEQQKATPLVVKQIAVVGNITKPAVRGVALDLIDYAEKQGLSVILRERMADYLEMAESQREKYIKDISQADLIVTLGGDGTLLHTVRTMYPLRMPILAVNMGNLGFNTQATPEQVMDLLQEVVAGRSRIQERLVLQIAVQRGSEIVLETQALNDVVLMKTVESRIIHCDCSIDGVYACHYRGDGVILSTPTGSTAYNLAVGGPIIHPSLKVMSLTALCPARHGVQPLLIPGEKKVELAWNVSKDREAAMVCIDGQENHSLQDGDKIIICEAKHPLRLIINPNYRYIEILSKKIGWGGR